MPATRFVINNTEYAFFIMATFQEVFNEMLARLERADAEIKEKDLIIHDLECRVADLENQLGKLKKRKAKRKADNSNDGL